MEVVALVEERKQKMCGTEFGTAFEVKAHYSVRLDEESADDEVADEEDVYVAKKD